MPTQHFGARIKALRRERGLTQEQLGRMFGFKDRQTVSAIETGVRQLTAEELVLAVEKLGVTFAELTDPFRLVGEGRFSWREEGASAQALAAFERRAGSWIAAFRELGLSERDGALLRRRLPIDRTSNYEDAMWAGERFAAEFQLGATPAERLAHAMEEKLGVLVLFVEVPERVSGAACRLREFDAVLIARREVPGRRSFDLAHELFHLLTWEALTPVACAASTLGSGVRRVEKLADNFAAALLMPADQLGPSGGWKRLATSALVARLNAVADRLRVTAQALSWRLVNLGELSRETVRSLPPAALQNNGRATRQDLEASPPPHFSRRFVEVIGHATADGRLSTLRVADLLGLTIEEITSLFADHGVECPLEV